MNLFHAFYDCTENVKMITEAEATDSTVTETQAKEVSQYLVFLFFFISIFIGFYCQS